MISNTNRLPTSWLQVLINEFPGQIYKFTCGRWLGQNIDDGSTERYMVGYPMSLEDNSVQVSTQFLQLFTTLRKTHARINKVDFNDTMDQKQFGM